MARAPDSVEHHITLTGADAEAAVSLHTFSSPFIPGDQLASSPWGPFLSSLKTSEKNTSKARENARITLVDRQTGTSTKVLFTTLVHRYRHFRADAKGDLGQASAADRTVVPGFIVTVSVDNRSPKKHEKWLKENEDLD